MDLDPDFAELAGAEQAQNNAAMSHTVSGGSGLLKPNDPTNGMSPFQLRMAAVGQGMANLGRHAGNLVGLESDQDLKDAKALDAPLMARPGSDFMSALGQSAAMAPASAGLGMGLSRFAPTLAASPIASGAVQGAAQGALTADPGQRLQGMGLGAVTGAALPTLGKVGRTLVNGLPRTPEAQLLMDNLPKGTLTPGQMNPTGMVNRGEQALEGALGVGDLVQNARDNSMKQYTRAMIERSMAPGAKLNPNTTDFNDMIDEASKSFDTAYDAGKGFPVGAKIMQQTGPDVPLRDAFKGVIARARAGITAQDQAAVGRNVQDLLSQSIKDAKQSGGMESDDLLSFRSQLRTLARGETGVDNASRAKRDLYGALAGKVTDAINSQIPTDAANAIQAADAQYGKFVTIQNAVKSAKDRPGGPTPFQISSSIAKNTPAPVYARGGGANRDLSKAAADVFQNNVPRTGLAGVGRLLLPLSIASGSGLAAPQVALPAMGALAGLTLTRGGRALAGGQTGLQQALASKFATLNSLIGPRNTMLGTVNPKALAGAYARGGLLGLEAPRLQQMGQ